MCRRSFLSRFTLVLCFAALQPALAQQTDLEARSDLALNLTQSEVSRVRVQGELGQPLVAVIELHGRPVTLLLAPRSVRSAGFQLLEQRADGSVVELDPGPVTTYRGEIVELPGSNVAASLQGGGLFARLYLPDGQEYWLEPLAPRVAGAATEQHVLYRREDVICRGGMCGADLLPGNLPKPVAGGPPSGPDFIVRVAELACDTDYEYFLFWGSSIAVSNRIQSVIGAMNMQFETEVEITHEITTILVRASSFQPYTSTSAGTLLSQFRTEWNGNQAGVARDVAHLFTGKNLDSPIVGVAYVGVVCVLSNGYSLTGSDVNGGLVFQCATDISAHELGHNWNATHCTCPDSTMNPSATCTNTFSPIYSRPEIIAYRDSVGCLDTPGGPGPTLLFLSDGFESGNLGGWAVQNGDAGVAKQSARTGAFGARLKRTTWIERAVDTSGYPAIRLDYSRRTANLDANERLHVEWWSGSAWQVVESTSSTSWADQTFLLDAAAGNNPAFRIRFRTDANLTNERGDVDNVRVGGS